MKKLAKKLGLGWQLLYLGKFNYTQRHPLFVNGLCSNFNDYSPVRLGF